MVLCHQITGFSPARLDYPLCLRVNAKFLRCQCNGSKHLMLRVLLPGRDYSLGTYIILKQSKNINYFRKKFISQHLLLLRIHNVELKVSCIRQIGIGCTDSFIFS